MPNKRGDGSVADKSALRSLASQLIKNWSRSVRTKWSSQKSPVTKARFKCCHLDLYSKTKGISLFAWELFVVTSFLVYEGPP